MKDSYVFYRSFYNALQKVKDKELRADLYDAICELGLNENIMELDSEVGQIIMELIEPQLTANQKRYENASKSGRPKTINDQEIERLILEGESNKEIVKKSKCSLTTVKNIRQKLAKNWSESQKPNVNDNVNVNDNDYISSPTTPTNNNNNNKSGKTIFDVVQKEFGRALSPIELEIMNEWLAKNYSEELILYAVKEAILNNAKSLKYVQRILERLEREGIKTVSEAQKNSFRREEKEEKKRIELFDYDWLNDDEGEENEN